MTTWPQYQQDGYFVLTWDWKEQLNLEELTRIINFITGDRVRLREVDDTGGDQNALVIENVLAGPGGKGELDSAKAQEVFEAYWTRDDD